MERPVQTVSQRIEETLCHSLAFDIVAGNGNLEIVKKLYEKNSEVLSQEHPGSYRLAIPVVRASNAGHREVTRYLYEKTPSRVLMHDEGYWARCLLFDAVFYGFLGIKQIFELKKKHSKAHNLLQKMCKPLPAMVKDDSWKETVYKALLDAVEYGNKEFFIEIIKSNPQLLWISEPTSGRNLFQLAVGFRKEAIFNLIYGLDDRKISLLRSYDQEHNNILHIAAQLSPPEQLSQVAGAALKMQRETHWFEEVKSLVSEREIVEKNKESKTPRQVFEASHEPLRKEAEKWMKCTATACSFVAAIIATVTFQAIFTVPGGTDEISGEPLLLRDSHFMAFIIVDALSFFASCTSVLIFLSILTARYSFDDFIVSLPRKMILALTILFIAIAAMLIAFTTALFASMRKRPILVVSVVPLAYIPGVLFLILQYSLFKEMISFTYGKGLFHRNTKRWF
ncbi:PREDICTED: ankyrin repeat-containing protein ITN1-like [Camelina sativa]|uniref:Ankyrin repeat-containing protein ITN1-like n=1 Tax=Camelina sativa TaxID=90675 RepID=A0ABM1QCA0_CAMSA|nr:PREDICTED: ankyrin repeat-containing protein ITN1-like [Camelina sativa]